MQTPTEKSPQVRITRRIRIPLTDLLLGFSIAIVGVGAGLFYSNDIDPVVFKYEHGTQHTSDIWFEGDLPKIFLLMTDRNVEQHRVATEHPLISLAMYPPVQVVRRVAGVNDLSSMRCVMAALCGLWLTLFYSAVRLCGVRRLDSAIFTGVCITHASAMFWFAVPEIFAFGSASIFVSFCLFALAQRLPEKQMGLCLLASVASLTMTVTNWMVGIFGSFLTCSWRKAIQITINALFIVTLLWSVQQLIFPYSQFFLGSNRPVEFILPYGVLGAGSVVKVFALQSVVMPDLEITREENWQGLSIQHAPILPGNGIGKVAVAAWIVLLVLGCYGIARSSTDKRLKVLIVLTIACQLLLHIVFGEETFLYSLHFSPFLILLAAFGSFTRFRILGLSLAAILILSGAINNHRQLQSAKEFIHSIGQGVEVR